MMRFNELLKEKRVAKNLSQQALSEQSGISQSFIAMLERGSRSPSIEVASTLGKVLDCTDDIVKIMRE